MLGLLLRIPASCRSPEPLPMDYLMKPGNCCSRGVQKAARTLQDLLTISIPQIVVAQNYDTGFMQIRSQAPLFTHLSAHLFD